MIGQKIEPQLVPAAIAKHRRLERKLRACFEFCLERLAAAIADMRSVVARYDTPWARSLLAEYEAVLSEIREIGASELPDLRALSRVQNRLLSLYDSLETLRA